MRWLAFLLALVAAPALADVTITNFNGGGSSIAFEISHHDTDGNAIDAHDGNIMQVGSTFYRYGEAHRCGWRISTVSAWCGFRVYSSTDLVNWTDRGYLFDASISYWQTRCAGVLNSFTGCYRPKMIYNAANDNYVMWYNVFPASFSANHNYGVLVCTTPIGGCTVQADPANVAQGGVQLGDQNLFVDTGGTAYVIYARLSDFHIYIDQLNAAYTDSTGTSIDTGGIGEGVWMFERSGTYYIGYGPACPYCDAGAASLTRKATSAQGTYGAQTTLNSSSCSSQPNNVTKVVAGASTTYLFNGDQWTGQPNQGWATTYYQPLSFTGSVIDAYSCQNSITVPGLTLAGTYPTPTFLTGADQVSVSDGIYHDRCDVNASIWRLQTFVPSVAGLVSVRLPLGQNTPYGATPAPGSGPTVGPDGNLSVSIVTLDGSSNPVSTVVATTIAPAALQWATQWTTVPLAATLTIGTPYGILLKGVGTTVSCFSLTASNLTNGYPAGIERVSTNAGASWSTDTNWSFMFATYGPVAQRGGGRLFGPFGALAGLSLALIFAVPLLRRG